MMPEAAQPMRLHSRTWGSGRPSVLLLHGFADGGFVWEHIAAALCPGLAAIALDMRGHGRSPWDPQRSYAPEVYAADVTHAIESLGLGDLTIVGHSLGAEVAIRVAARTPGKLASLVLVDGGPEIRQEALDHLYKEFQAQPWYYESVEEYAGRLAARLPLAAAPLLQRFAQNALRPVPEGGFMLRCDPALRPGIDTRGPSPVWGMVEALRCPILLVRGSVSAVLTRIAAAQMTQRLRDCQLGTIPMAGHAVMLDNPEAFVTCVNRFLAGIRPARAGAVG